MTTKKICLTDKEVKELLVTLNNVLTCHDLPKNCPTYVHTEKLIKTIKEQTGIN